MQNLTGINQAPDGSILFPGGIAFMSAPGAPTNAVTGAGFAGIGSSYTDMTTGKWYTNGGTMASPAWKIITSA